MTREEQKELYDSIHQARLKMENTGNWERRFLLIDDDVLWRLREIESELLQYINIRNI